jgi:hypothetical protein
MEHLADIALAVLIIVSLLGTGVLLWISPPYDSLPKNEMEDDGPWPDGS